ncbi:MAG TPA: outer membrane beta-barrel protein [Candidatus Acidoferrum sp.]|jgi:opacity protein-like surface antigen
MKITKHVTKLFVCLLLCAAPAAAQGPKISATGPAMDLSLGYTYFDLALTPQRANLQGVDTTFTVDFRPRLGVQVDLSYSRAADVNGTTHHADALTYMAGPVFYVTRGRALSTYVHALGGGARISGVLISPKGITRGYINEPAVALGGGVEYQISRSFAVRGGIDYVRASFLTSPTTYGGLNNFRATASIVYQFGSNRP